MLSVLLVNAELVPTATPTDTCTGPTLKPTTILKPKLEELPDPDEALFEDVRPKLYVRVCSLEYEATGTQLACCLSTLEQFFGGPALLKAGGQYAQCRS